MMTQDDSQPRPIHPSPPNAKSLFESNETKADSQQPRPRLKHVLLSEASKGVPESDRLRTYRQFARDLANQPDVQGVKLTDKVSIASGVTVYDYALRYGPGFDLPGWLQGLAATSVAGPYTAAVAAKLSDDAFAAAVARQQRRRRAPTTKTAKGKSKGVKGQSES